MQVKYAGQGKNGLEWRVLILNHRAVDTLEEHLLSHLDEGVLIRVSSRR